MTALALFPVFQPPFFSGSDIAILGIFLVAVVGFIVLAVTRR